MLEPRLIPCLLIDKGGLVKTTKYQKPIYLGDPVNTCRIFNELEVDEICIMDIRATLEKRGPDFQLLAEIANECFMPLAYGGGIFNLSQVERLFSIGFEKVILNSALFSNQDQVEKIVSKFGSQAVVASVDVRKSFFGKYEIYSNSGTIKQDKPLLDWIIELERLGVGEILLNNIDKEGTWEGIDIKLIKMVSGASRLPLIAHGGAGSSEDIVAAIKEGEASAVGLGNMVVYQKKGMGVLINFPDKEIKRRLE